MLTEGWDANTVTHILGVRAFGTQLLCEQVVGRGLRRMSYAPTIRRPVRARVRRGLRRAVLVHPVLPGRQPNPKPGPMPTRVRALEDRIACEITFPRLAGLSLRDADRAARRASSVKTPGWRSPPRTCRPGPRTRRSSASRSIHTLDDLKARRANEVAFLLSRS